VTVEFAPPKSAAKGALPPVPLTYGFTYGSNSGSVSVTLKGTVK
jgi:hypothetical protein